MQLRQHLQQTCALCHVLILVCLHCLAIVTADPQPCPENSIVLTGGDYPQYVYSPYDEFKQYPPNTDCRFVLVARNRQRRIHINIVESRLEEPLFTDCKDYVSVRDGGLPTSQELIRWCGSYYTPSLTSSGDSLYIHFHSDNIVQNRGFNLSFVDYAIPGCPPDWIHDPDSTYCYKLFDSAHGYTFKEAQDACYYERSNLLTIEDLNEYQFIVRKYSDSHRFPWIGYNDAGKEGVFEPIDPNVPKWPENFPESSAAHLNKDCVFLDWNIKDGPAHTIEDCRTRHAFICKKRQDGTTIPIQLSSSIIRHGYEKSGTNVIWWLLAIIILLILLMLLWFIYQKCKRRNVVGAAEQNRLVQDSQPSTSGTRPATVPALKTSDKDKKGTSTDAVKRVMSSSNTVTAAAEDALQKAETESTTESTALAIDKEIFRQKKEELLQRGTSLTSPRIRTTPNQPVPELKHEVVDRRVDSNPVFSDGSEDIEIHGAKDETTPRIEIQPEGDLTPRDDEKTNEENVKSNRSKIYEAQNVVQVTKRPEHSINVGTSTTTGTGGMPPVGEPMVTREETNITIAPSTYRSRGTQRAHGFERPHVGTLEHVSAISLDEFWQDK